MQDIIYIIGLSTGSLIILFLLTKMMGNKQLSELSIFDYITGITIGSIAAEMATSLEQDFVRPIVAMVVYTFFSLLLAFLSEKSFFLRKVITGKPVVLIDQGIISEENLKKSKIDLSELLVQCRVNGYFDIAKIQTAILEENGKISFLPKSSERPVTPKDLHLQPQEEYLVANLIIDGNVMEENLKLSGKDQRWLKRQLSAKGMSDPAEVLLATCDIYNQLTVYPKHCPVNPSANKLIN